MFPTIVYKCPGNHSRPGGTYDFQPARDEQELRDLIAKGWFKSMPEAIEGVAADNSAPKREELEQQAKELDIKFDGRTSDKKLTALIEQALGA